MYKRQRFDTEVRSLAPGARPTLATGDGRVHEFDAVVLCLSLIHISEPTRPY